jgi:16S rRNA G966 N2-methylase RsmD
MSLPAAKAQARDDANRADLQRAVTFDLPAGLHVGDFREKASILADECAELVFTDPPYDRESIPLFGDAAALAARVLKPGGSFIAYCGQIQLPEVLLLCAQHLRYWWVIANVHSAGANQMDKYGIKNHWKPLVWFVKGTRGDVQTFVDDTVSGGREKTHHVWQQAESEASYYIEKLTSRHGLVLDFFAGGGTTVAAAESLGRPWIAFEQNPVAAERIAKRLRPEAA